MTIKILDLLHAQQIAHVPVCNILLLQPMYKDYRRKIFKTFPFLTRNNFFYICKSTANMMIGEISPNARRAAARVMKLVTNNSVGPKYKMKCTVELATMN